MAQRLNYTIWQWNCRGFRRKRGNLQQFVASRDAPDIIALQEVMGEAKLAGYKSYSSKNATYSTSTAVLVHRNHPVLQHTFDEDMGIAHMFC